jgi:toxin ParE1/3/4
MTAKPVIPREQALGDVEAAIDYYAIQAGADVALEFIDPLESAVS